MLIIPLASLRAGRKHESERAEDAVVDDGRWNNRGIKEREGALLLSEFKS